MKNTLLNYNSLHEDPTTPCLIMGNGYRHYNPVLMRFTKPDRVSPFSEGGINTYTYCSADPINRTDPDGHHSILAWSFIGGGLILGTFFAPVSGGSTLVMALSIFSVLSAAVSTGLAITEQFLYKKDPKTASIMAWAALGTGALSIAGFVTVGGYASKTITLFRLLRRLRRISVPESLASSIRSPIPSATIMTDTISGRADYEAYAYATSWESLRLPAPRPLRGGIRRIPRLGSHLRMIDGVPVYSLELQGAAPLPEGFAHELNLAYDRLGLANETRYFSVPRAIPESLRGLEGAPSGSRPPAYNLDDPFPRPHYVEQSEISSPPDYEDIFNDNVEDYHHVTHI